MVWRLVVPGLFAVALLACGGSGGDGPTPTPARQPDSATTKHPDSPYTSDAIWDDVSGQTQAIDRCSVNRNADSYRFCVEQEMQSQGASQDAIDFYLASGRWLVGFYGLEKVKAGLVLSASEKQAVPRLAFLRGDPALQLAEDLYLQAFPRRTDGDPWAFERDPMYARFFDLAKQKFQNADDPLLLRHFSIIELEGASNSPEGTQHFIAQIGIHNFCEACGVGVAARYAFDFDSQGKSAGVRFLGLCQGQLVTREVERLGKVSFHEFSGVKQNPRGGGISEPYLIVVPGLQTCPSHVEF
jgi:hypothetical protein